MVPLLYRRTKAIHFFLVYKTPAINLQDCCLTVILSRLCTTVALLASIVINLLFSEDAVPLPPSLQSSWPSRGRPAESFGLLLFWTVFRCRKNATIMASHLLLDDYSHPSHACTYFISWIFSWIRIHFTSWIRICVQKNCWIRKKWMRIHSPAVSRPLHWKILKI